MYDANLICRNGPTAGALSGAGTTNLLVGTTGQQGKGPEGGLAMVINVPIAPTGTSPTLDVKIQESPDGSVWRDLVVFPQITALGKYIREYVNVQDYTRCVVVLGGTTPAFGNVDIRASNTEFPNVLTQG